MSDNTERFTGRVEDYERYRLRYPEAVIEILERVCGLQREQLVADIGAGTGMLADLFLEHGNAVIAIEPNDDMRAACEKLASAWPGLTVKKGTAEATGLEEASVDLVAVGRAFHWFDHEKTAQEFRRILRPEGWVVLVSNSRLRDESPLSLDYEALLRKHGTDYEANRERYDIAPRVDVFFTGGELIREEVHSEQRLTLEELVGQTQSLSVTPESGHVKYEGMQAALREFFAKWQADGVVTMSTTCKIACGQFSRGTA
ncbi:class I SAM-dependent methyltransferase [Granulicella sp. S190]|uniref:class I SAM-dependent methyltransferase n=1 Tax=Granulicella sp. S190 TaxID=1747226 RepID=UPI00131B8BFB|nr:class I SAM-dependent methyltransferase [Granulicella sp. S190]